MPLNNPYYLNNVKLHKSGVKQVITDKQIKEFKKCKNDICYFAEKYFTIVSIDKGKIKIPLYDYQKDALELIEDNRFTIFCQARQCCSINTIIKIKNKKSGKIEKITIGELYEIAKKDKM